MTTKKKEVKKEKETKSIPKEEKAIPVTKATRINNVYVSGVGLQLTLENVTVLSGNMNAPYRSPEYGTYSSSIVIALDAKIKKEIYELLAHKFKDEKHVAIALEDFLTKKIKKFDNGLEGLYASVSWKESNGELSLSKPLDIEPPLEEGERFPHSFKGCVQIGFSFSQKFTFPCYLNGVLIEEIIQQEGESFSGLQTTGKFNPTVSASSAQSRNSQNDREDNDDEPQTNQNIEKKSSWADKFKSKFK